MNVRVASWIACSSSILVASCGSSHKTSSSSSPPPDTSPMPSAGCGTGGLKAGTFQLMYQGVQYGYIVHLPPSYDPKRPAPLVLNWHAYQANAMGEEGFSNFDPVGDAKGFVVVYPDSPDQSWNAGTCCAFTAMNRDDVGFAMALVDSLEQTGCIDTRRIFATGMSNGAFMAYRLGCEHAETFAAIAPVAGKVGIPNCNPSRAVPLIEFHGTADNFVPYDSGILSGDNQTVPETVASWAMRDACTDGPTQTFQNGTVTCQRWSSCKDDATVTLCTAQGEGHCWPGQSYCPIGASTTDVDASAVIGDFFTRFSLIR
ncbi:MAG TPA: PHB depolymerase family esterase [Polyangiaceae bacterium]|nr:PHB depolymerase family esterase [Polyangiaceae bacterium]